MASFSVVAMVLETEDVLRAFASYYARRGAARIALFYDAPECPFDLSDIPNTELVALDDAFWQGDRPADLTARQAAVFSRAYTTVPGDWVIIVDADEYMDTDLPLAEFLDRLDPGVIAARAPPSEAVYGPGDDPHRLLGATHFRRRMPDALWARVLSRLLYGAGSRGLFRRGLLGHQLGKQMVRTGVPGLEIGNHVTRQGGEVVTREVGGARLLHHDAAHFPRWKEKWGHRVSGATLAGAMAPARRRQFEAIQAAFAEGEDALLRLYLRYYGLTSWQYRTLAALGLAFRRPGPPAKGENRV